MKQVIMINGSPRTVENTASAQITAEMETLLQKTDIQYHTISVRKTRSQPEESFNLISQADAIICVFPLYYFCLPGILMQYFQEYAQFKRNPMNHDTKKTAVYAVINCGFPEPEINAEAVRVLRSFCSHTGMEFKSAACVGSGPMIFSNADVPPAREARSELTSVLQKFASAIIQESDTILPQTFFVHTKFPKFLYYLFGSFGWKKQAKHHGLSTRDLYRRPYQTAIHNVR